MSNSNRIALNPISPLRPSSPRELPKKVLAEDFSSSIERSHEEFAHYIPSKPILDAPRPNTRRLLNAVTELEALGDALMLLNQGNIEHYLSRIQAIDLEEAQKMKEAVGRMQDASYWHFLTDLASLLSAAFSTVLGINLVSTGTAPLIGGALIASGVLSIVNFTFKESGAWDWVAQQMAKDNEALRKQLSQYIPLAVGLFAAGIGLAGTAAASRFAELSLAQKILTIGQTAATFATGVTSIGEGRAQAYVKWTETALSQLQMESRMTRFQLENVMTQMQEMCENQSRIADVAGQVVEASKRAVQIIHQVV